MGAPCKVEHYVGTAQPARLNRQVALPPLDDRSVAPPDGGWETAGAMNWLAGTKKVGVGLECTWQWSPALMCPVHR